jgi:alkylated DNA nucleotide flippase Atl1
MVDHHHEPPPVDDFASHVLDVVDSIPPGRVMSYGDIAEYLAEGAGPRQVGRVMAVYGGAVPWWRVIHADGTPAPGHDSVALQHYLAEGTPLRSVRPPVRVDIRRARWPTREGRELALARRPSRPRPDLRTPSHHHHWPQLSRAGVNECGTLMSLENGSRTRATRRGQTGPRNVSGVCWNR